VEALSFSENTLSAGEKTVLRFTIAANAAEQVSVKKLAFELSKTAAPQIRFANTTQSGADSSIRRYGESSNLAGAATLTDDGSTVFGLTNTNNGCDAGTAGTCLLQVSFTSEEVIPAGTAKTYDLRLTFSGSITTSDNVSARMLNEAAVAIETTHTSGTAPVVGLNGTNRAFIWSDNSAVPHTDSVDVANDGGGDRGSQDYTNGSYVKVLPSDTQTLKG